jgi:hypothetical protein
MFIIVISYRNRTITHHCLSLHFAVLTDLFARAVVTTSFALSCVASCRGVLFEENSEKLTKFSDFPAGCVF